MKKWLTSFFLVLVLSFSLSISVFAVDDSNYYSLPPVTAEPSLAIDWPVKPVGEYDSILSSIFNNTSTANIHLSAIQSAVQASNNWLSSISSNTSNIKDYSSILSSISSSISSLATEFTLSKGLLAADGSAYLAFIPQLGWYMPRMYDALYQDIASYPDGGLPTLYHLVKNLSDTLASEDDKELAQNQKENREQAEQDFLNGKSGKTSLGKGDFSNASQVGGALNDTFNMGGASKVSDFLSGFGSAGSESQAWFSQTTANNLNAVEASDGTQGVSTFADDGETMVDVDPDPYNMGNIFERYDWLEGVNLDG